MTSELLMKLQEEKKAEAELKDQVMKQREADVMVSISDELENILI